MGRPPPLLTVVAVIMWTTMSATAEIQLVNRGYERVVVAISENVSENPDLLTNLESILTEGSKALFAATRNQLYFREFIIVIPQHWQTKDHYGIALDIHKSNFNFLIDQPNPLFADLPYTKPYRGCGQSQSYAHITPAFVLNARNYSGRTIVHEWGHLRWGLFDEYQFFDNGQDRAFYREGNKWHPTRCSTDINGKILNINSGESCDFDFNKGFQEKNSKCQFFPNVATKATASLMFANFLDNVVEFCDDPLTAPRHLRHNRLAPNLQNRLCDNLSAWEVMRKHSDFVDLQDAPALPKDTNTRPKFRYVQRSGRKQVLVLDVSGSMEGDPLDTLIQVASAHIMTTVEQGSQLGIAQFSGYAQLLSDLVLIKSEKDRDILFHSLPKDATGGTSIGAGLELGMEILAKGGPGGSILLITDGEENEPPMIEDVKPKLLQKGIPVHVCAIGQSAENAVRPLASETGGKIFFHSMDQNSTALIDAFAATVATARGVNPGEDIFLSILTDATVVTANSPVNNTFIIDSTIGRETYITFSYTEPIEVGIESPDGPYYDTEVKNWPEVKVLRIALGSNLTAGHWSYRVTTEQLSSITVSVQSKPRYPGVEPLLTSAWMADRAISFDPEKPLSFYVEVSRGKKPVEGAVVRALLTLSNSDVVEMSAKDDGRGSDLFKGDGIYSGNILPQDLTGNGRYNMKIKVEGKKNETKEVVAGSGFAGGALDLEMPGIPKRTETRPLEDFQRVATAGEFHITNFTYSLEDRVPPARIADLDVKIFNLKTLESTLVWTAVGGDMERGRASRYIIYAADDVEDIIDGNGTSVERIPEEDVIHGNLSLPAPSGDVEEFVIHIKSLDANKNKTIFLSVMAIDESGNRGKRSNIVSLSRAEEFSVPVLGLKRVDSDPTDDVGIDSETTLAEFDPDKGDKSDGSDGTALAVGLSVTLCVLLLVILVIVLLVKKRRKQQENRRNVERV